MTPDDMILDDTWPPNEFFPKLPWTADGETKGTVGRPLYILTVKIDVNSGGAEAIIAGGGSTREEAYSDFLKTCGELGEELFRFMTSQIA